jgi:hypothetical protein
VTNFLWLAGNQLRLELIESNPGQDEGDYGPESEKGNSNNLLKVVAGTKPIKLQITFRHFLEYFPLFVKKRRSDYLLVTNFLWLADTVAPCPNGLPWFRWLLPGYLGKMTSIRT